MGDMQLTLKEEQQDQANALIRLAIEKGIDTDKLGKLIELRNNELARQAKQDFSFHFNEMQKEYVPVQREKTVKDQAGTKTLYKFCPLEDILKVYAPIIGKHGFSFRWSEEAISEKEKRIYCIVSGYGHEEKGYVDIPIQSSTSFTNSIQQRGVSSSYGKRYSFINAFGVIIEDEDDDTQSLTFGDGVMYSEQIKAIDECKTMDDLQSIFSTVYKSLGGDRIGQQVLTVVKDAKKKEVSRGTKN